jgi:hypothetical protein
MINENKPILKNESDIKLDLILRGIYQYFQHEQERKDSLEKWVNNDRMEEKRE